VQYQNQTFGARVTMQPTTWWQHAVAVGIDRYANEQVQTQPRLTTPGDTLLVVAHVIQTKTSIGYNTSVQGLLSPGGTGSLPAGVDHYSLPRTRWYTAGAFNTTGTIRTDPGQPVSASRTITNNTGYFAQV